MARSNPHEAVSMGADIGATWLRAAVVNSKGETLHKKKEPAPKTGQIAPAIRRILNRWKLRPDFIVVGATGYGDERKCAGLRRQLEPMARKRVFVTTDLEIAARSTFPEGEGILAVAGTGSGAWGRDRFGHTARSGGWGPLLGDEGSAFWIGKHWLRIRFKSDQRRILEYAHRPDLIRAVAALAPHAVRAADDNRAAREIVNRGQAFLASHVRQVSRKLHFLNPPSVGGYGGLFQIPSFSAGFVRHLNRAFGASRNFRWHRADNSTSAEIAAAMLPFGRSVR